MRLYFAGITDDIYKSIVRESMKYYLALSYSVNSDVQYYGDVMIRALVSFWALKQTTISEESLRQWKRTDNADLFLDSGAFSASTQGVRIGLTEYIDCVQRNAEMFSVVSVLDVIGDHQTTMKNLTAMELAGLKPLPVFHYGSPLECLRELVGTYKYICLGGLVPLTRRPKILVAWLDACFSIIGDSSRVHGFGMGSWRILTRFPFYSCDSSSWNAGQKNKEVYYFKDGVLRNYNAHTRVDVIRSGGDLSMADTDGQLRYKRRTRTNINAFRDMEKYLTHLWAKRGVVWDD